MEVATMPAQILPLINEAQEGMALQEQAQRQQQQAIYGLIKSEAKALHLSKLEEFYYYY